MSLQKRVCGRVGADADVLYEYIQYVHDICHGDIIADNSKAIISKHPTNVSPSDL